MRVTLEWKEGKVSELELMVWDARFEKKILVSLWVWDGFMNSLKPKELKVVWKRDVGYLELDGKREQIVEVKKRLQWNIAPYEILFRVRTDKRTITMVFRARYKKTLRSKAKRLGLL